MIYKIFVALFLVFGISACSTKCDFTNDVWILERGPGIKTDFKTRNIYWKKHDVTVPTEIYFLDNDVIFKTIKVSMQQKYTFECMDDGFVIYTPDDGKHTIFKSVDDDRISVVWKGKRYTYIRASRVI